MQLAEEDDNGVLCVTGCGNLVSRIRWGLGYHVCLACGDARARKVKHTIVPLPKSNYIYAHTLDDVISPYSHKGNR